MAEAAEEALASVAEAAVEALALVVAEVALLVAVVVVVDDPSELAGPVRGTQSSVKINQSRISHRTL